MLWWPLLFISFAFAQDVSFERYCFSSPSQMKSIHARLKPILIPSDKADEIDSCLTISMAAHRRELIQRFVLSMDPNVSISFSSAEIKREPCHLKVEKYITKKLNHQDLNIHPQNASATTFQNEIQETSKIQTLKGFELRVNEDVIVGECRYITPHKYEVTIEVRRDLPPIINTNVHYPTSKLVTQVQINRGNKIELGSVVRDLKSKQHQVDASPSANLHHQDGKATETVFLSIE